MKPEDYKTKSTGSEIELTLFPVFWCNIAQIYVTKMVSTYLFPAFPSRRAPRVSRVPVYFARSFVARRN